MTFVLVKFLTEEVHLRDLLDGKIYANRLSWFRRIEESDDSGRGDKYEGIVGWFQSGRGILTLDGLDIMRLSAFQVGVRVSSSAQLGLPAYSRARMR